MADPICVGDVVVFRLTVRDQSGVPVDVSGATTKQIKFRRPGVTGTTVAHAAAFTASGTDGQIEYRTTNADLDAVGTWTAQGYVVGPGYENSTQQSTFYVAGKL